MGNSLWNKLNNKNKQRKSNYEISKKTNIPEDKVKEIMDGDRELPTDRVDEFVGAIQENTSLEKKVNVETAKRWLDETDLKALRLSFNYASQTELSEAIGFDTSVICRLENKKLDHVSDNTLLKYYDFFQDKLNVKLTRGKRRTHKLKPNKKDKESLSDIKFEDAYKWYLDFDFKEYLTKKKLSYRKFGIKLGYSAGSTGLISNLVNHKLDESSYGKTAIVKAYAFINKLNKAQIETKKVEDSKTIKEDRKEAEKPNKDTLDDVLDIAEELKNKTEEVKMRLDEVLPSDKHIDSRCICQEPLHSSLPRVTIKIPVSEYTYLTSCKAELEKAKKQLSRYEKLIDMIER